MHPNAEFCTEAQWEKVEFLRGLLKEGEGDLTVDFPYKKDGIMVVTPPSMIAIFIEPDGTDSQGLVIERKS